MLRNQYDMDVVTWSPQGRLHQVEYAMEAVKQGSCAVGLRSKTHVVLCTLKRNSSELSTHQKKLFKIDDHVGMAISGLTADARVIARYMRNECLNHRSAPCRAPAVPRPASTDNHTHHRWARQTPQIALIPMRPCGEMLQRKATSRAGQRLQPTHRVSGQCHGAPLGTNAAAATTHTHHIMQCGAEEQGERGARRRRRAGGGY